jgi:predicted ester cyclase
MDVTRMVTVGDEVWVTGNFRGTQTGDLAGEQGTIPASGNAIDVPFAEVFTIRDGRIARQETYWDQMTMMAQLGALPAG